MDEAIALYHEEQKKPQSGRKSIRTIAFLKGVDRTTLGCVINGGMTLHKFNGTKKKLTDVEEAVLVDHVLEQADRGFPFSHKTLAKAANAILEARGNTLIKPLGKGWVSRFLIRHCKRLQTHWSKALDTARANNLNRPVVTHWFRSVVKKHYVDAGILPENTYGMDESGFLPEASQKTRVIGARGTKTQHMQGTACRENVTALVTICADGTALRPTVIFKARKFQRSWINNNFTKAS